MLFNSQEFLFVFLPLTLLGFLFARPPSLPANGRSSGLSYCLWSSTDGGDRSNIHDHRALDPHQLSLWRPILLRLSQEETSRPACLERCYCWGSRSTCCSSVFSSIPTFYMARSMMYSSANLILTHIILPLGISFITFQKIAFLIDVQAGRVKTFTFREYCTFVLFFPQLIAGPIVHYREMMPQFEAAAYRFDKENFAVALTLLCFGLFKKVVLADNIAPLVTPIYERSAAAGNHAFPPGVDGGDRV